MKYKIRAICSHCGAVSTRETYEFGDTLFLLASFGCEHCHMSGAVDEFITRNAETEISPSLYYGLTPYGLDEAGTFHFMIGGPKLVGRPFH